MKAKMLEQEPLWGALKLTASNAERKELRQAFETGGTQAMEAYMNRKILGGWRNPKGKYWEALTPFENFFRQGFMLFKPKAVENEN